MKKSVSTASFLLALTLLQQQSTAAEVDQYTISYDKIVDSAEVINGRANDYLAQALRDLNQEGSCEDSKAEEKLYKELQKYFANHSNGELCKDLLHDERIERTIIPLDQSVYQDWSILNGLLLGRRSARNSPLALGPIVKMGKIAVGTDKFEHMFGMGFRYFNKHHLKKKSLISVLKSGAFMEKTALGGNIFATGVFSYGDLSANFNGMRFWNHMLQKNDDVLGKKENLGPYIVCKNNNWKVYKEIDFRKYIDLTMDESVNCSKLATKSGLEKLEERIIGSRSSHKCLGPNDRSEISKKYDVKVQGDRKGSLISHWIINRKGHGKVSYFNEY